MTRKKQRTGKYRKNARPSQKRSGRWRYIAILILAVFLIGAGGGWLLTRQGDTGSTGAEIQLAPVSQLPEKVRAAPVVVQEAYRFAIANPEVLVQLPCYCGCGGMGHESDLDCFIEEFNPDGSVAAFGYHAFE
jgi:hypothetical protein